MTPTLKVENLHKVYATGTHALDDFSLEIHPGEFFALLGPNGGGKTTLINIISGPTKKTSGKIKVAGLDIETHRQETKMMLGVVPQELVFDSFFNVNEVMQLQSGYYGIRNNQKRIDEILEKLDLHGKKFTNTRALSGGMKRRLLVAKALVHKPKLLILDEPTAGVDVELRHNLWSYMRELNKEGLTILLTTHYLEEAENLCDRTAIIHQGKLVALDQTKKLIRSMGTGKKATITFKEKIKEIPKELEKFEPHKLTDHDLSIQFELSDLFPILENLKHLKIADINIEGQSLEDVFIELTYRQNA